MDVDRVAMVSLRADGTPDQGPDFEVIAPAEPAAAVEEPAAKPKRRKAGS